MGLTAGTEKADILSENGLSVTCGPDAAAAGAAGLKRGQAAVLSFDRTAEAEQRWTNTRQSQNGHKKTQGTAQIGELPSVVVLHAI